MTLHKKTPPCWAFSERKCCLANIIRFDQRENEPHYEERKRRISGYDICFAVKCLSRTFLKINESIKNNKVLFVHR